MEEEIQIQKDIKPAIYTATIDCTNCTFFHNGTQVSGEALDNYFNVSGAYTDHITIH